MGSGLLWLLVVLNPSSRFGPQFDILEHATEGRLTARHMPKESSLTGPEIEFETAWVLPNGDPILDRTLKKDSSHAATPFLPLFFLF